MTAEVSYLIRRSSVDLRLERSSFSLTLTLTVTLLLLYLLFQILPYPFSENRVVRFVSASSNMSPGDQELQECQNVN